MWSAFFHSENRSDQTAGSPASRLPITNSPVAMTIAGSDNSAGAGMQADLKTFSAHGVYGLTAVTCVVSEVPGIVSKIEPLNPSIILDQIQLGFKAFPVRAVKTGMLYSSEIIVAVAQALRTALKSAEDRGEELFIVVDPVMVASSGDPLLQPDALAAYENMLFPIAHLITPNLDEAASLLGSGTRSVQRYEDLKPLARELSIKYKKPFLLKGGHLKGPRAVDLLVHPTQTITFFESPFFEGLSPHGTGCSYSAAIAASLAKKESLETAVAKAKRFISEAIRQHLVWQAHGTICLNHGPCVPPSN